LEHLRRRDGYDWSDWSDWNSRRYRSDRRDWGDWSHGFYGCDWISRANVGGSAIITGNSDANVGNAPQYIGFWAGNHTAVPDFYDKHPTAIKLPRSGTARKLYVTLSAAASATFVVSDGVNSISCSTVASTTCNSGAASASFTEGNTMTVRMTVGSSILQAAFSFVIDQ
jgi:hypothetical protein